MNRSPGKSGDIKVSSKTLGHISAGLYRRTAGAMKELVSNSFDANATVVRIMTNWPRFRQVSCSDNGDGMTMDDFVDLMEGGIGDSTKRQEGHLLTRLGRPIIGRIGIGILGIAQFCHEFEIWSHHRDTESAFWARVQLIDYLQERIDEAEAGKDKYEVGHYECDDIQYEPSKAGVTVVATDMKKGFVQRFEAGAGKELPKDFRRALKEYTKHRSVYELEDYWKTIWELSVLCPVSYLKTGPVRGRKAIPEMKQELETYNFNVVVDGMRLYKPVLLPSPDRRNGLKHRVYSIATEDEVYGQKLRLGGYIFAQDGYAVWPSELRGIILRVKNVGIGTYDKSFLDYPIAQGPRFGWISGEIYALEGLEDALNVDRDSFNESHPHFLKVRAILHEQLEDIFSQVYKDMRRRSSKKRDERVATRKGAFLEEIAEATGERYEMEESLPSQEAPVLVDRNSGTIFVNSRRPWPGKPENRQLAEQLAAAYDLAQRERTGKRKWETFFKLLARVLKIHGRW